MPATRPEIVDALRVFLEEETGLENLELTDNTVLGEELGLNSVDLVGVVMRIEGHYKIRLQQADLQNLAVLGDLVSLIEAKTADSAGGSAAASRANAA